MKVADKESITVYFPKKEYDFIIDKAWKARKKFSSYLYEVIVDALNIKSQKGKEKTNDDRST